MWGTLFEHVLNRQYLTQNEVVSIEHDLYIFVTWTLGYLSTDDQLKGNDNYLPNTKVFAVQILRFFVN